jgi:hypothetical protein
MNQRCQIWYPKIWVSTQVSEKVIPNQVFGWKLAENWVGSEPRFGTRLTLDQTSIGWLVNFDSIIIKAGYY